MFPKNFPLYLLAALGTLAVGCGDKDGDTGGGGADSGSTDTDTDTDTDGGSTDTDGGTTGDGGSDSGSTDGGGDSGSTGDGGAGSDADVWMVADGTLREFGGDTKGWYWTNFDYVEIASKDPDNPYHKIDIIFYDAGVGTYDCAGTSVITYSDPGAAGYSAKAGLGECEIVVTALGADGEAIEGSFTATLVRTDGSLDVTEGYFNVTRQDQ